MDRKQLTFFKSATQSTRLIKTENASLRWGNIGVIQVFSESVFRILLFLFILVGFTAACSTEGGGGSDSDAHVWNPDSTIVDNFNIRQVEPNHGPTNGGVMVTIRGVGFEKGSKVWFGENQVDPATIQVVDQNRVVCKAPGGSVGHVNVRIQNPMGAFAELENGFHYDYFYVDPPSGTVNGGTFVRLIGTETTFDSTSVVTFNNNELEDVKVVNSGMITGRTPPGTPGSAIVRITSSDDTWEVAGGFEYYTGADPVNGGLGGGPIQGELTVTILDTYSNEPIEGVFVILGVSETTPYQGYTDDGGRMVFSDPDLMGPQMLTAAHPEYERVSFVAFDAREVTAFMTPEIPPQPGTFPGISYSAVYGRIYFGGVESTGDLCNWGNVMPEPEPGYTRTLKVYQTVPSTSYPAPRPGVDGIIREGEDCENGYAYSIYTRPGSYAVYVLAGMENDDTKEFSPIIMGVTRGLNTAPGDSLEADIWVDIFLGLSLDVELSDPPPLDDDFGPSLYRTSLFLDLGGDGFMVREDHVVETYDATELVVFDGVANLFGSISDGSYSIKAQAYNYGTFPYSEVYKKDVQVGSPDSVFIDGFLGIPMAVAPEHGGELTDYRMTWSAEGDVVPSFQVIYLRTFPDGDSFWRLYLNGTVNSFTLPNLSGVGDLSGYPADPMVWYIYGSVVPGMEFNEFSYRYMSSRYWTASTAASYSFQFGAMVD